MASPSVSADGGFPSQAAREYGFVTAAEMLCDWTDNPPTEPGWYLWQVPGHNPQKVEVLPNVCGGRPVVYDLHGRIERIMPGLERWYRIKKQTVSADDTGRG